MKFPVVLAFLVTSCLPLSARDIYVSQMSQAPGNGSEQLPFQTIQEAINVALAGDRIKVERGEYREKLSFPRSGKPGSPITLEGSSGAYLRGVDFAAPLLEIDGKSHIALEKLKFVYLTKPGGAFVRITGASSEIRIQDCYFYNRISIDVGAIEVVGNDRRPIEKILVDNIFCAEMKSSQGVISLSGNVRDFLIKDNYLAETVGYGIKLQATRNGVPREGSIQHNRVTPYFRTARKNIPAAVCLDGAREVRVTRNALYFFGTGIEVLAEKPGSVASDILIRQNRIERNKSGGITLGSETTEGEIRDCLLVDNRFVDNAREAARTGQITVRQGSNISILKNKMAVEGRTIPLLVTEAGIQDVESDYNHFQSPNGSSFSIFIWGGKKFTSLEEYQKATGQDLNSKVSRIH